MKLRYAPLFTLACVSLVLLPGCWTDDALPQPPFEQGGGVLRGTWVGEIEQRSGSAPERMDLLLEELQATQTGPDSYAFEGKAAVNGEEGMAVVGTGTVETRFAPTPTGQLSPQRPRPSLRYDFKATISSAGGEPLWRLEGDGPGAYRGTATNAAGEEHRFNLSELKGGLHLITFRVEPDPIRLGEEFSVIWSGRTAAGRTASCEIRFEFEPGVQHVDDCMSGKQRLTLHAARPSGAPPEPFLTQVVLAVRLSGDQHFHSEFPYHVRAVDPVINGSGAQ